MSLNNVVQCDKCGYRRFGFPLVRVRQGDREFQQADMTCPACGDAPHGPPEWWNDPVANARALERSDRIAKEREHK